MGYTSQPKLCFILGIDQRSGTNFLFNLLNKHPECVGPGPIWEDKFLKHSHLLTDYTEQLFNSWNPKWEVEKKVGDQTKLLEYFGRAIENFLRLQLHENDGVQSSNSPKNERDNPKILLTKTPTVECLKNFFYFFPEAYLIVLVRDGRAVVESGVQSFGWGYEHATKRWRDRAEIILNFCKNRDKTNNNFLLLKYEDLVKNQKSELVNIFNFMDLNPDLYDYESASSLGVIGSSELKKQTGQIHWEMKKKKEDFNPLARFESWDQSRHERFNWIAGKQMQDLGYSIKDFGTNRFIIKLKNNSKSIFEGLKLYLQRTKNKIIKPKRND